MNSALRIIVIVIWTLLIVGLPASVIASGDSDGDGYSDAVEVSLGTDPFDANSFPPDNDQDLMPDALDSDDDNDGVLDIQDAFPLDAAESVDTDGDGVGDNADADDDNDCYADVIEIDEGTNPLNPSSRPPDCDGDCIPNSTDTDDDNDGTLDTQDPFPCDSSEWLDNDGDGVGDNSDQDDDNDSVSDGDDVFPLDEDEHEDTDGDGIGNNADTDDDDDGFADADDLYPTDDTEWADIDGDGVGDNADPDSLYETVEAQGPVVLTRDFSQLAHYVILQVKLKMTGDGLLSMAFIDPQVQNIGAGTVIPSDQVLGGQWVEVRVIQDFVNGSLAIYLDDNLWFESENEETGVLAGGFFLNLSTSNVYVGALSYSIRTDLDGDGVENSDDTDDDGDGVVDADDSHPLDSTEWDDFDGDGIGDNADQDDDNDGISDDDDAFPYDENEWRDTDNDGIGNNGDPDDDNDGTTDDADYFPLDPDESVDNDGDGFGDSGDTDDDDDGLSDDEEIAHGLDPFDSDSDDDGVIDGEEPDPFADTDGDGLINALDPDSDDDGIMDGTEMGLTTDGMTYSLNSSKANKGTQLGSPFVIVDQDPSTTTDPLNPDTDGGGLPDGEEDVNHNGKLDAGELDPLDPEDENLPHFLEGGRGGCSLIAGDKGATHVLTLVFLVLVPVFLILVIARSEATKQSRFSPPLCKGELEGVEADSTLPSPPPPLNRWRAGLQREGIIKKVFAFATVAIILLASPLLFAQATGLNGYNLQLFRPTVDGKGVITVNGSGILGHLQPHVGFYTNFSQGLLTATTPVGNRLEIVDSFLTGDVVASIGLWDRVNVGVDVPVFFFERGRNFNTAAVFDTYGVGDTRLDIKVQALRDKPRTPGVSLLSSVYLPTGETSKFTGYKNVGYQGTVIVDKEFKHFYLAANVGYKFVQQQTAANIDHDDELTFGAGFRVPLPIWDRSVELIGEVYGSTVIKDPKEITTPVEALGGIRKNFSNGLGVTVAGGAGLTDGAGSPTYRVLAGVTYTFGRKRSPVRETIYFDSDKWLIRPKHMDVLDGVVRDMKKGRKIEVTVAGHADSTESTRYNIKVSKKRALNVKDYLIKRGINPDRMFIRYYGETQPVATNKTREGRAQNRRVNITSE